MELRFAVQYQSYHSQLVEAKQIQKQVQQEHEQQKESASQLVNSLKHTDLQETRMKAEFAAKEQELVRGIEALEV